MLIVLTYLNSYLGNFTMYFQILIVIFNLLIFSVSLREKKNELLNSQNNLDNVKRITH